MWNNDKSSAEKENSVILSCPYCDWIIPEQLVNQLLQKSSTPIICEQCGNEIKKEYYNLDQLRKYREGKPIDYKKLIKRGGKKLYSALKSKYRQFIKKTKRNK